jgi:hypothetical protein
MLATKPQWRVVGAVVLDSHTPAHTVWSRLTAEPRRQDSRRPVPRSGDVRSGLGRAG